MSHPQVILTHIVLVLGWIGSLHDGFLFEDPGMLHTIHTGSAGGDGGDGGHSDTAMGTQNMKKRPGVDEVVSLMNLGFLS